MNNSKTETFYQTKIGAIRICASSKAITNIAFAEKAIGSNVSNRLTEMAFVQISEYIEGGRKYFDLPIEAQGTDFQKKVWFALQQIPYGSTCSYQDIAVAIGNPKAARAVGMANNRNPLAIIVPCHRVIGSNGKMVGYAGGIGIKSKLLELEKRFK